MTKKSKKIFVLWSGGMDSTYLILKLLSEGHSVDAGYIDIENNEYKNEMEQKAINNITPIIQRDYSKFNYVGVTYKILMNRDGGTLKLRQVPLFILGLLYEIGKEYDEVAIGYVVGDCVISWLDDIRRIWKSYKSLLCGKIPKLTFPLHNYTKEFDICDSIPESIRSYLVWCENPKKAGDKFENCGNCLPCKRNKSVSDKWG